MEVDISSGGCGWRRRASAFDSGDGRRWTLALAFDGGDGWQLWQRWTIEMVFNGSGGSGVRQHLMASAMDYDKRMRGWRKERQRNNQPT